MVADDIRTTFAMDSISLFEFFRFDCKADFVINGSAER